MPSCRSARRAPAERRIGLTGRWAISGGDLAREPTRRDEQGAYRAVCPSGHRSFAPACTSSISRRCRDAHDPRGARRRDRPERRNVSRPPDVLGLPKRSRRRDTVEVRATDQIDEPIATNSGMDWPPVRSIVADRSLTRATGVEATLKRQLHRGRAAPPRSSYACRPSGPAPHRWSRQSRTSRAASESAELAGLVDKGVIAVGRDADFVAGPMPRRQSMRRPSNTGIQ